MNIRNSRAGFPRKAGVGLAVVFLILSGSWAQATEISSTGTGGYWDLTSTWNPAIVPTATDNVTIVTNTTVTLSNCVPHAVSNLTINSGGTLTHSANTTNEAYKVVLNVGGDLSIATNGLIDVTGKGYSELNGPAPGNLNPSTRYGSSHGGLADNSPYLTYGCITAPTNLGSGGHDWGTVTLDGGGAAILHVTGITTLNGAIKADGMANAGTYYCPGAGGSVWLTTATLAGSGTISAKSSAMGTSAYVGGGGRIAVELTAGESFDNVSMLAYGTVSSGYGAAGTVYRETASQGPGNGTLIVDNGGHTDSGNGYTQISTNVTGTTIGTVLIQNQGQFGIQGNCSFTVLNGFTNLCQTASLGGTLVVGGSNTCSFGGGNTVFYNLTCTNAGKTILFATNTTFTVGGALTLVGGGVGNEITVDSGTNNQWKLNVSPFPSRHSVRYVNARNSNAGPGATIQAYYSVDSGNNSNWVFAAGSGMTNAWTGSSNTTWGVNTNWSLGRAPVNDDYILITNGCAQYPLLNTNVFVNVLDVRAGGSLSLNRYNMIVTNLALIAGTLSATGTETVTIWKDVDFTGGTFNCAQSSVLIAGVGAQSLTFDHTAFNQLTVQNPTSLTFTGPFSATNFLNQGGLLTFSGQVAVGSFLNQNGNLTFQDSMQAMNFVCVVTNVLMTFHAGSTYSITNLYLCGTRGNLIRLRSTSPENSWKLNVSALAHVFYVDAQDSDASAPGLTIYAVSSTNSLRNVNWVFGDSTWLTWIGGASTSFTNANNWIPAISPGITNRILIDGNYTNAPRIANSTVLAELAVGGYAPATLTVDAPLQVSGNMTILTNGIVTHSANTTSELYKVNVTVSTNLTIDAGGAIDVTGKGYSELNGPAPGNLNPSTRYGASHGGLADNSPYSTYGCITAPTNLGSGGHDWGTVTLDGGGAAIVRVAGNTILNGAIKADGMANSGIFNCPGAGGSVWLTTATLAGSGTISAKSSALGANAYVGGGGRIAVDLTTGNDFGNVSMLAYGTINSTYGAAGTVYRETASQGPGNGILVVDNGGYTDSGGGSTLISTNVTGTAVGTVLIQNQARFTISNQLLTVNGSWSNGASFTANTNSTVSFDGANTATFYGNSAFFNLRSVTRNKSLVFQAGKTNTVQGMLQLNGPVLTSTAPGNYWYLTLLTGGVQNVRGVSVRDGNATNGQTIVATSSVNLGHNVNWRFPAPRGTVIQFR